MADAWGNAGQAGQFPLEQWFYEMPLCTRWWTSATLITSLLVQCHVITPFQLFYSFRSVFVKSQVSYDSKDLGQHWDITDDYLRTSSTGGLLPHFSILAR